MYLKSLYLKNFRNYSETEIQFSPELNVIYGDNAQGKTNLLEAIYLVATGRSFRQREMEELIQLGETFFFIEGEIVRAGVAQCISLYFDGKNRKLAIGSNRYATFQPLLGELPTVLYTPYDMELIMGAPQERRRFINLHLAQSDPLYVHHYGRFWKAMKERNCLLKKGQTESIDCWETEMAHSAEYVKKARIAFIEELKHPFQEEGKPLSNERYDLELSLSQSDNYLQQLQKNRLREFDLGMTLTGPHRDELTFFINESQARHFASEGQKKTAIGALRLAEWKRLSDKTREKALLGIDDLDPHLDETRQKSFRATLAGRGQVFITTPHSPLQGGHTIHIHQGRVLR